ncbi:hypothetical protein NMY22_g15279 [Coprinellus aureogranulatus]|nr:hypothetical protein NMY22_g15279 [Coprinellus aureogranulatus]
MDDLESLFYVFLDVVVGMDGPSSSLPRLADQFFPQSFQEACDAKLSLFRENLEFDLATIPLYWGETTKELFQNFFKLIRELVVDKDSISRSGSQEAFLALENHVPHYFDELQEHFKDAIDKLNEPTPLVAPSPGLAPIRLPTVPPIPMLVGPVEVTPPAYDEWENRSHRSPLKPRVDENVNGAGGSPPLGNGKRKAHDDHELENQPLAVKQRQS